jgi:hypothetical protein
MSGKMNYERQNKEDVARRNGSEWIGSDSVPVNSDSELQSSPESENASTEWPLGRIMIPGCICQKAVGFTGDHKKSCGIKRRSWNDADLKTNARPTLQDLGICMKKVRQSMAMSSFLSSLQKLIDDDRTVSSTDRQNSRNLIRALQEELRLAPQLEVPGESEMNSSIEKSLRDFIQAKSKNVYLCADHQDAVKSVESVAGNLKLQSFRFECSSAMHESELWNRADATAEFQPAALSQAYVTGGIFCLEHVERAVPDLQAWLKSVLDGHASVPETSGARRHPDFVLVLTSPVPLRKLWPGKVDHAFIDRLTYLDSRASS